MVRRDSHPPSLPPPVQMYYGGGNVTQNNTMNTPVPFPFVTASLRGRTDGFMLKGGDATQGTLKTMYDGPRPFVGTTTKRNYQPMKKQGAIILATGGDQSNSAQVRPPAPPHSPERALRGALTSPPPPPPGILLRGLHDHGRHDRRRRREGAGEHRRRQVRPVRPLSETMTPRPTLGTVPRQFAPR